MKRKMTPCHNRTKLFLIISLLAFSAATVFCLDPEVKKHKVWIWQETGDCLWKIAQKYYGDPYKWKYIYEANKPYIKDPRVIFPKQILEIPSLEEIEMMKGAAAPLSAEEQLAVLSEIPAVPSVHISTAAREIEENKELDDLFKEYEKENFPE